MMATMPLAAASPSAPARTPAGDVHRPQYHFTPARNWLNDPNGLVYYEGEYHLFYQYNPHGDRWGHMSWGHAVSRDLVHWQELPVAIPETDVMAFSGSAVIDWKNSSGLGKGGRPPLIAVYTGHDPRTGSQAQFLAYSNDKGRSWTRYGTGPVLDIDSTEFRDPKVFWHAPTKRWVMVVVMAAENRVALYTSPDLKSWMLASHFGPAGAQGKNWECPDLFELPVEGRPGETRWVLSVNLGDNAVGGGSGGQYFVGDFDGTRFTPDPSWGEAPAWMDYGADFYAAVSWNDLPKSDPRRIWIGWANDWRYAESIPTYPSRGAMSLPRTVALRKTAEGYRIAQAPVRELAGLRSNHRTTSNLRLGEQPVVLAPHGVEGGAVELDLDIDTGTADQLSFVLTDGQGYETLIGVNPTVNEVFIDRTRSGPHFHDGFPNRHVAPVDLRTGRLKLRIFVDQSIIELFVNDGTQTITDRFYRGGGPLSWSAVARNGTATIRTLDAWTLADAGADSSRLARR
ncbi:beta-fructosidase [Sphingomonas oleivorans]|uniref:Beta-fructosidase n=2 Tax=Sphingomonas oleivorans TaxID=1735121 RepID=A0A2T5FXZ4_9SPHN|nr:beta-fructosidase [Sphingomonas oleivorans]